MRRVEITTNPTISQKQQKYSQEQSSGGKESSTSFAKGRPANGSETSSCIFHIAEKDLVVWDDMLVMFWSELPSLRKRKKWKKTGREIFPEDEGFLWNGQKVNDHNLLGRSGTSSHAGYAMRKIWCSNSTKRRKTSGQKPDLHLLPQNWFSTCRASGWSS